MWGSIVSYLGQYYPEENVPESKATNEIENGWVLVDMEGNEMKTSNGTTTQQDRPAPNFEACLGPLPLLDISNTSTPHSSPQLSPTKIEEGWFVAPPPCFTKNSPGKIEVSPLEDLLIEHPSMSVYSRVKEYQPRDKGEAIKQVVVMKASEDDIAAKRTKEPMASQVLSYDEKPKMTAVKSQLDLKSLLEQTENMKPGQQAKWQSDQFKLCPSYLNRQNRVHRYQSRKHHNQKKKSLAKPFAEKGKHSF